MLEPEVYPELHPVDMLVDLVMSEELDPWDVDIADIAGRFHRQVKSMVRLNLRLSGRTLLAASVLLRIKSERLFEEEEDREEEFFEAMEEEEGESYQEVPPLKEPLRRKVERRATIFEMVEALQHALKEELVRKNYPRKRKPPRMVMEVDEESAKEKMEKVYTKVKTMARGEEAIKLGELMESTTRMELVETLLSLLYLEYEGKLRVWQEELFGEIFVALLGEGEAA